MLLDVQAWYGYLYGACHAVWSGETRGKEGGHERPVFSCALCGDPLAGSLSVVQIVWRRQGHADRLLEVCDWCCTMAESLIELCACGPRLCDERAA